MTALSRRRFVTTAALASVAPALPAWAAPAPDGTGVDPIFGDDIVRLDYNESPYGPDAAAIKAMTSGVRQSGRYDYEQQVRLSQLFASQHDIPHDHVALYCGSRAALQCALASYAGPRSVVTAAPTYDSVASGAKTLQARVHEVPLTADHAHDVRGMLAVDRQAGVIYVCNPNNPTGTLTPHADITRLVADKPPGCLAIIDEAYIHFSDAPTCLALAVEREDVLVLRTFSKIYGMAGARLGVAIGNPALLARLEAFNGRNFIPLPTALGAIAALENPLLVTQRKATNAQVLADTVAALRKAGFPCTDAQANCFMVNLGRPVEPLRKALEQRGVRVGRVFEAWPDWLRVTVGTATQMQRFLSEFFALSPHASSLV